MVLESKLEELKMYLLMGKYNLAEKFLKETDENEITYILIDMADDIGVCVYSFIEYMIEKTQKIRWRELAIEIMVYLAHIEGAYSVALFHARQLLSVEKTVENLEMILFFYEVPEKLVDNKEAKHIATEILKLDMENEKALDILERLKNQKY